MYGGIPAGAISDVGWQVSLDILATHTSIRAFGQMWLQLVPGGLAQWMFPRWRLKKFTKDSRDWSICGCKP